MATTDSRAANTTISSTIDEGGGASGGDDGRIESENTTTTKISDDDFDTGRNGDGGWNQSGILIPNSVSDYYSTNGSSIKEPEDESLELSDSLASADELGSDESGRSRRLAKRRKLSSTSTSYSLGCARQYERDELSSQGGIMKLFGRLQEIYGAAWVYQTFEWICWSDEAFVVVLCGLMMWGWFRVYAACFRMLRLCLPRKKKKKKCKRNWCNGTKQFHRRKLPYHLVQRCCCRRERLGQRPPRHDGNRLPSSGSNRRWRRMKKRQRCNQTRKEEQSARETQMPCSDDFPTKRRVRVDPVVETSDKLASRLKQFIDEEDHEANVTRLLSRAAEHKAKRAQKHNSHQHKKSKCRSVGPLQRVLHASGRTALTCRRYHGGTIYVAGCFAYIRTMDEKLETLLPTESYGYAEVGEDGEAICCLSLAETSSEIAERRSRRRSLAWPQREQAQEGAGSSGSSIEG